MDTIAIRETLEPGDLGAIVFWHGRLYADEYGFDHTFEPYVAKPLADFVLSPQDGQAIWVVETAEGVRGSIAIVRVSPSEAQLRWLLVHPQLRGGGIGRQLVQKAVDFSRRQGYASVFLWTLEMLAAATHLYTEAGFALTESKTHRIWGRQLTEQRFELVFTSGTPVSRGLATAEASPTGG
jgi:GNAT superfamily N-acetyltransferase